MKKLKWILSITAFVLAAAGLAGVSGIARAEESENAVIPSKVYIGDVAVGGMTAEEAKQAVLTSVEGKLDAEITLRAGANEKTVTARELGVEWANTNVAEEASLIGKIGNLIQRYKDMKDLENEDKVYDVEYSADYDTAAAWLEENTAELNQDAVNNGLKREDGAFVIIEGQEGIEVDVAASAESIVSYFTEEWDGANGSVALTANVVEPEGSREDLEAIQDVMGSFSTYFGDSAAGRITNVKHATSLIDGTVLYPGEEFSVYDAIAPLNAENGYELAGAYENGTTVESYGGGVCQVSTTLYNAVIRAELEVTERFNHSMLVSYVKPSMDAAIAGTYKNLRFVNPYDKPIYIEGYTSGGTLYFNIFGDETRPANREVRFESETVSEDQPVPKFEATADPIGVINRTQKAHVGKVAKLWKIVLVDGVEQSREVFNNSKYNASPDIYSVGTASANTDAVYAITTALTSQDEATIRAAAEYWSDTAIAAREQEAQAALEQQQQEEQEKKDDSDKKEDDKKDDSDKKNDDKKGDSDEKDPEQSDDEQESE